MPQKKIRQYTAQLPFLLTQEDIERLRGLGEVRVTLVIEGENRQQVAKELAAENQGWHVALGDRDWWENHLSRGRSIVVEAS